MIRRSLIIALVVAGFLVPQTAGATTVERHHCREECDGGGDGNGNSGGEYGGGHSGDQGDGDGSCRNFCNITVPTPPMPGQQPKESVGCLVPVPWHCDQKPSGFIPPNPSWDNGAWNSVSSGITSLLGMAAGNGSVAPTVTATEPSTSAVRSLAPIVWRGNSGLERRRQPSFSSATTATTGSVADLTICSSELTRTMPRTPASRAGCQEARDLARTASAATSSTRPTLTPAPTGSATVVLAADNSNASVPTDETAGTGWRALASNVGRPVTASRNAVGPAGFLPPDPRKIPQQIADFVKLVGDFVQGVVRFAV